MNQRRKRILDQLDTSILRALSGLETAAGAAVNAFLDRLEIELRRLKKSGGRVLPTVENIRVLEKIRRELFTDGLGTPWSKEVGKYAGVYKTAASYLNRYYGDVLGAAFTTPAASAALRAAVEQNTIDLLTGPGARNIISQRAYSQLYADLPGAPTFTSLVDNVKEAVGAEKGKFFKRYAKTTATDAVFGFSRAYTEIAGADLDFEWYEYTGSLIDTSRPFCVARAGKVWHVSEIKGWGDLKWEGRNPATNSGNIFVLLGGYNCGHRLLPVPSEEVPKEAQTRAKERATGG